MQVQNISEPKDRNIVPKPIRTWCIANNIPVAKVHEMPFDELVKIPNVSVITLRRYAQWADRWPEWEQARCNPDGFLELPDGRRITNAELKVARGKAVIQRHFGFDLWEYSNSGRYPSRGEAIRVLLVDFRKRVSDEELATYLLDNPEVLALVHQAQTARRSKKEAPPVLFVSNKMITAATKSPDALEKQTQERLSKGKRGSRGANDQPEDISEESAEEEAGVVLSTADHKKRLDKMVRDIFAKLSEQYDLSDAPENDLEQVKHLASLMARRRLHDEELHRLAVSLLDPDLDDGEREKLRRRYEWEQKHVGQLDDQIGKVGKELQITPQGRAALQGTSQAWEVMRDLVQASKDIRQRLASYIIDGPVVMGMVIFYHPHPRHAPFCGNCGSHQIYVRGVSGRRVAVRFWPVEAERLYTRARDFVPNDAPRNIGVFDHAPEDDGDVEE